MSIFDSAIESDAQFAFGDAEGIGAEAAMIIFAGGTTRSVYVVVNRNLPSEVDSQNRIRYPILVNIQNNATRGITASELDTGSTKISVPYRQGGSAQQFLLGVPEAQDAGMLVFRLFGNSR